jgi:hypothetical protein
LQWGSAAVAAQRLQRNSGCSGGQSRRHWQGQRLPPAQHSNLSGSGNGAMATTLLWLQRCGNDATTESRLLWQ